MLTANKKMDSLSTLTAKMGASRRRHERFPATWPVSIKLPCGKITQGTTENVSGSGLLFFMNKKIDVGKRLYVKVESYSYGERKVFDAIVSVRHLSLSKDVYRHGVEIIKTSEETKQFLSRYAKGKNPHLTLVQVEK